MIKKIFSIAVLSFAIALLTNCILGKKSEEQNKNSENMENKLKEFVTF